MKQIVWEHWFIISVIICIALMFVGTLEGSREITSLPYLITLSFINITICTIVGNKPSED